MSKRKAEAKVEEMEAVEAERERERRWKGSRKEMTAKENLIRRGKGTEHEGRRRQRAVAVFPWKCLHISQATHQSNSTAPMQVRAMSRMKDGNVDTRLSVADCNAATFMRSIFRTLLQCRMHT